MYIWQTNRTKWKQIDKQCYKASHQINRLQPLPPFPATGYSIEHLDTQYIQY